MHKTALLTIAIASLTPLHSFSSTCQEHGKAKRPPPLILPADFGMPKMGPVFENTHPASHNDQTNRKRSRIEEHNFILILVKHITSNPSVNFFEDAYITNTNHLYCPKLCTLLTPEPCLTKEDLAQLISDIKELINPAFFLPPPTEGTKKDQRYTNTAKEPISLKFAKTLYDRLVKIATPQEHEFLHLTGAYLNRDGTIYMPELERVITMKRLLEILSTPEDGEFAFARLSNKIQALVREEFQRIQTFRDS
ncbi:MAG TPA: hypothetical protein DIC42_06565 [Holosporales bacterium]|nr:hypothetical protein [Holosporales bacterium]